MTPTHGRIICNHYEYLTMCCIKYFSPSALLPDTLPQGFPSPFSNIPQPIAQFAALELQRLLSGPVAWSHDFIAPAGGKMFGVLVVRDADGRLGYLSAFSGMLAGEWCLPGFVPPIFDQQMLDAFLPAGEARLYEYEMQLDELQCSPELMALNEQLESLQQQRDAELSVLMALHQKRKTKRKQLRSSLDSSPESKAQLIKLSFESQQDKRERCALQDEWRSRLVTIEEPLAHIESQMIALKRARSQLSNRLHRQVFKAYHLTNQLGEVKTVSAFFDTRLPAGGTGDCAAPKLLQYAHQQRLTPIAMAEFWWGASPQDGVRHHGNYYPACRGKCHVILPFMLKGMAVMPRMITSQVFSDDSAPEIVYEDDELLVVNKPSGLLSVPGKETRDSVQTRLRQRYPEHNVMLVHRLDMSTSGLLLVAKQRVIHKALQRQFIERTVEKRYVAVLSKRLPEFIQDGSAFDGGSIELPLRVDIDDRPRQIVCNTYGKRALTRWQVIKRGKQTTHVYFYPHTGRTHQLRIHAAHRDGLDAPIYGDELYGESIGRLLLHAERLCFDHPVSLRRVEVVIPAPF